MFNSLPSIGGFLRLQSVAKWSMLAIPAIAAIVLALDFFGVIQFGRVLVPVAFGSQILILFAVWCCVWIDRAIRCREQWLAEGRCRFCGYRLFDLPTRAACPECGKCTELDADEKRAIDRFRNSRLKKW